METAAFAQIKEMRVVSRLYRYTLHDPQGDMSMEYMRSVVDPIWGAEVRAALQEMNLEIGAMSTEEERDYTHRILENVAKRTRLVYTRTELQRRQNENAE